jgi:hypothetical protein
MFNREANRRANIRAGDQAAYRDARHPSAEPLWESPGLLHGRDHVQARGERCQAAEGESSAGERIGSWRGGWRPLVQTYVGASSELSAVCELNRYEILREVAEAYFETLGWGFSSSHVGAGGWTRTSTPFTGTGWTRSTNQWDSVVKNSSSQSSRVNVSRCSLRR